MFLETIANINNFCYKNIYLFKVLPGMGGGHGNNYNSQTCIKRSPLGQRKSGLLR
jgi:hypothetical protein